MDSYKSDAEYLTFNGTVNAAANSGTVLSEHVPLGHGNGVTGTEISAGSDSFPSDSNLPVVHLNVPDVALDEVVNVAPDVLDDEVNVETDVHGDEVNVETDVRGDEVNVDPHVVLDNEVNVDPHVVLDDEVNVERNVEIQSVLNDIVRYRHSSSGRKRTAAEAIAEYLSNHSHKGESCFCRVFSWSSNLSDSSSSHHVTDQSNPMTRNTGIGITANSLLENTHALISRIGTTETSLLENTHALISPNAGSGESTADVVDSSTQTMIPEGEGELEEDEERNRLTVENEVLLEIVGYIRNVFACLRVQSFYLCIKLHKYELAKSTCLETKEHCCICLEDYCDGEELGEIDCGHGYHVECIKEWIMIQNSCPICKREALALLL